MTPEELLELYDREVRGSFPDRLPAGWTGEQDGPLTRCLTPQGGFAMFSTDPSQLSSDELEALVARTFEFYAERGRRFEWKTFEHDRQDLIPLLVRHGAVAEPREALVLGESAVLAGEVRLPDGLTMRSVSSRADVERVAAFESEVWDEDWAWLADDLAGRLDSVEPAEVLVVEDGDLVVSAAWLVPLVGTGVAGLWGGSTRASYRGRGIYRSLVAHRAGRAVEWGYPTLQVDASEDSRPILERLGLHVVGGTVPYETTAAR